MTCPVCRRPISPREPRSHNLREIVSLGLCWGCGRPTAFSLNTAPGWETPEEEEAKWSRVPSSV